MIDTTYNKTFKFPLKTENNISPASGKFYRLAENNFIVIQKSKLNENENEKNKFLNSANVKLILTSLKFIK